MTILRFCAATWIFPVALLVYILVMYFGNGDKSIVWVIPFCILAVVNLLVYSIFYRNSVSHMQGAVRSLLVSIGATVLIGLLLLFGV